jgi:hypothetical protein
MPTNNSKKCFKNIKTSNLPNNFSLIRGFNIGIRLIDEFLAKSDSRYCSSYREIADTLAKVI